MFKLDFSICNDLPEQYWCLMNENMKGSNAARAVASSLTDGCVILSPSGKNIQVDHFILDKDKNDGLKIHLQGNQSCDEIHTYDLTIDIKCDPKAEFIQDENVT